jgi:hypothetical protein
MADAAASHGGESEALSAAPVADTLANPMCPKVTNWRTTDRLAVTCRLQMLLRRMAVNLKRCQLRLALTHWCGLVSSEDMALEDLDAMLAKVIFRLLGKEKYVLFLPDGVVGAGEGDWGGRGGRAAEGSDAICSEDMALEDLDAMLAKVGIVDSR